MLSKTGCWVFKIKSFADERGFFIETFKRSSYRDLPEFVQDNTSFSKKNVVRGMHFQTINPQGKFVRVLQGRALDIVMDLRTDSPTFGLTEEFDLTPDSVAVYIPPGFAHGFCALEDCFLHYKCTSEYDPLSDSGLNPLQIFFPWLKSLDRPILSAKDLALPRFENFVSPFRMCS